MRAPAWGLFWGGLLHSRPPSYGQYNTGPRGSHRCHRTVNSMTDRWSFFSVAHNSRLSGGLGQLTRPSALVLSVRQLGGVSMPHSPVIIKEKLISRI